MAKILSETRFRNLLGAKLGDVKPLTEGFFEDVFGEPDVDRATKDSLRAQGWSGRGKDDEERPDEHYVIFNGEKFFPEDIEYASYDDLGDIPRIENGKLIVTNPAWEL